MLGFADNPDLSDPAVVGLSILNFRVLANR
jgi:hypothetical protein